MPGGGGTGGGSRGGFIMSLSLIKECPPVGGHSLMLRTRPYSSICCAVGFLARLLVGLLVWLLPILALLLLALLALALLLVTVLRGLLRVAVLGIVHR